MRRAIGHTRNRHRTASLSCNSQRVPIDLEEGKAARAVIWALLREMERR